MKTNAIKEGTVEGAEQGRKTHQLIKLGVDVHWHEYVVVRQIDGVRNRDRLKIAA